MDKSGLHYPSVTVTFSVLRAYNLNWSGNEYQGFQRAGADVPLEIATG
jgi:hypothetical protein